jgi:hypothetical protein
MLADVDDLKLETRDFDASAMMSLSLLLQGFSDRISRSGRKTQFLACRAGFAKVRGASCGLYCSHGFSKTIHVCAVFLKQPLPLWAKHFRYLILD